MKLLTFKYSLIRCHEQFREHNRFRGDQGSERWFENLSQTPSSNCSIPMPSSAGGV